jgi:hypothetical protein
MLKTPFTSVTLLDSQITNLASNFQSAGRGSHKRGGEAFPK